MPPGGPSARVCDYQTTPSLPDAEGKALLEELWRLYCAIEYDEETKKKVRRGSDAVHWATVALQTAIIKAAARFERHEEFSAWLSRNRADSVEAYDPVRGRTKQADAICDLEWKVFCLEDNLKGVNELLICWSIVTSEAPTQHPLPPS
jgi:hypothetical protein